MESVHSDCPNCKRPREFPIVCEHCGALADESTLRALAPSQAITGASATTAAPGRIDPFALFGVERCFDLDGGDLARRYRRLAGRIHPDRFASRDEETRSRATRYAAVVNDAWMRLGDPIARCEELLQLSGGPSASDVRTVDPAVLATVMEFREQLEEARASGDDSRVTALRELIEHGRRNNAAVILGLASCLPRLASKEMNMLRLALNADRYYANLAADLAGDPLAQRTSVSHG